MLELNTVFSTYFYLQIFIGNPSLTWQEQKVNFLILYKILFFIYNICLLTYFCCDYVNTKILFSQAKSDSIIQFFSSKDDTSLWTADGKNSFKCSLFRLTNVRHSIHTNTCFMEFKITNKFVSVSPSGSVCPSVVPVQVYKHHKFIVLNIRYIGMFKISFKFIINTIIIVRE